MEQDNAARRLCNMFEIALQNASDVTLIYIALGRALGITEPENDKHFITEIFVMLSEVDQDLKKIKKLNSIEKYIKAIEEIHSSLITTNLISTQWSALKSLIENRNFLLILESCASFIAQEQKNILLSETQLSEYLEQCEGLLKELIMSDLDDDIKTYIVVRLEEVCTAIRHYKIGGSKRLRIVIESNIGAMVLHNEDYSLEQKKGIIGKIFNFFITIGSVLDLGANTEGYLLPKLASIAKFLLPPG